MPFINSKYDYEKQKESLSKIDATPLEKEAMEQENKGTSIKPPDFSLTANDSDITREDSTNSGLRLYNHIPRAYNSSSYVNRTSRSNVESQNIPTDQIENLDQNSTTSSRVINPLDHLLQGQEENTKSIKSILLVKEGSEPSKEYTRPKEYSSSKERDTMLRNKATQDAKSSESSSISSSTSYIDSTLKKLMSYEQYLQQRMSDENRQFTSISKVIKVLQEAKSSAVNNMK